MKRNILEDPQCVTAAVNILGDKWTPLLIRALAGSPARFNHLQEIAGGINPRTLSQRLHDMEANGIVTKQVLPSSPPYTEYMLTEKGRDLLPILRSMAAWSSKYAS